MTGRKFLFDPSLLKEGEFGREDECVWLDHQHRYRVRPLSHNDCDFGFLETLSQLTVVDSSKEMFVSTFHEMKRDALTFVVVIEDCTTSTVVGSATAMMEKKFIHSCGLCSHIEDVVVRQSERGKKFGLVLIQQLIHLSVNYPKCYKVILDCSEKNVGFYEKCGLHQKEVQMVLYNNNTS